jgi:hypothetical protein
VHATTGRLHATIDRVPGTVSQVSVTIDKRRGEIAKEYHICFMPYRAEPDTSDMFHKWIGHVRWVET